MNGQRLNIDSGKVWDRIARIVIDGSNPQVGFIFRSCQSRKALYQSHGLAGKSPEPGANGMSFF